MEINQKFRNHFSIVFERFGTGFLAVFMLVMYEGVEFLGEIIALLQNPENLKGEMVSILLAVFGIIFLFAALFGIQIFRWSKTYISIQDQAIVIEVNTLKRKKNTIGIKNISNINLEQNLFEMLVGTYKVKMDTNSMSTADATDVKIVLKKKQAQEFQTLILGMIANNQQTESIQVDVFEEAKMNGAGAGFEEMLTQGLFSLKLLSIPLVLLSIWGVASTISDAIQEGLSAEGVVGIISSVLLIGAFGLSILMDIIKGFIRYYDFRIYRRGDRLHISYGLLKKVSYTIPVDKINAVRLVQSPQARIAGKYMAELVNVGMGDDKKEEQSFFLLYDKKDKVLEKIRQLLPEFSDELDTEVQKQSPKVWFVWILPMLLYGLMVTVVLLVLKEFLQKEMLIVYAVAATITVFIMLYVMGNYFTRGFYAGEKSLKIVDGNFGRRILLVKYPKIQYLETKQNFLAKHFQMQKGEIYLLASSKNRVQTIPYFPEWEVEQIKEALLQ